jgi:outer membrane protein
MLNQTIRTLAVLTFSAAFSAATFAQAANPAAPTANPTPPAATPAATPAAQGAGTVSSGGPATTRIAVISIQGVIASTNEFRRDFETLAKRYEPKTKEVEGLRTEIETLQKDLQAQGDKLNETERANRGRNIEQKQKSLSRVVEDAQGEFQQEQNLIVQRVGEKVMKVVEQFARQNNYAVVVDASTQSSPILWASEQVNISKPVLDLYNQQSGVPAPPASAPSATRPAQQPTTAKKPATTTPKSN